MVNRICAGCDAEIAPGPRERNKRKWCSGACRTRFNRATRPEIRARAAQRARERAAEVEAAKPPKPRCKWCGSELASRHEGHLFCSAPVCRAESVKFYAMRRPCCSVDGCERPVQSRGVCISHYSAWWRDENPEKRREIDARRRARKAGATVGVVDPVAVFDRDGWKCHLCGEKILKSVRWPDRRAGSLDHVIPLSRGGEHSMANVRASHLLCNMQKSAFGGGEQLALLG